VEHRPDEVAIEGIFYALNVKSALKLGQVRGVAMLAAAAPAGGGGVFAADDQVVRGGTGGGEAAGATHGDEAIELGGGSGADGCVGCAGDAICHLHTAGTLERQRAVAR